MLSPLRRSARLETQKSKREVLVRTSYALALQRGDALEASGGAIEGHDLQQEVPACNHFGTRIA